ncbi:type II secretion system protein [Clostridium sardiniense]|uniref:type II secretion system protein n=1 Tax=Clostridium sardiniense TaxID=29369 RepID=UPI003D34918C
MDGRKRFKKGYTIIECIAYIFISSVLVTLIMNTTLEIYKYTSRRTEMINREDEIDNAILNIRKIFNEAGNTKYIVNNNKIEIIKEEQGKEQVDNNSSDINVNSKEFEVISRNLRVKYYSFNNGNKEYKTSNLILENVKSFNVYKKENLIYVEIVVDDRSYLVCL